jgi:hypothetical protein
MDKTSANPSGPGDTLMLTILRAEGEAYLGQVRELILELAAWDLAQASRLHLEAA